MIKKNGISLIVLIITIIVMAILLTAIILNVKDENVSNRASEMRIKTDVEAFKEELENYISDQEIIFVSEGKSYNKEKLYANETEVIYDDKAIEGINIYDILPSVSKDNYKGSFKVEKGKLVFVNSGEYEFLDEEINWINEVLQ